MLRVLLFVAAKVGRQWQKMNFWYFFLIAFNWAYIITWPSLAWLAPLLWQLLIALALAEC